MKGGLKIKKIVEFIKTLIIFIVVLLVIGFGIGFSRFVPDYAIVI